MLDKFLRYFFGVMIGLFIAAAASSMPNPSEIRVVNLALAANAPDRMLQFQDAILILQSGPCQVKSILDQADADLREHLKGGVVRMFAMPDKPIKLCYVEEDGQIGAVDENGNKGLFPSDVFAPVPAGTVF